MEILNYSFDGEGMQRVFENEKWTVGIKNWKPANDITGINNLERHNKTDELFVLVAGSCTLIYANEVEGGLDIRAVKMEPNKVYIALKCGTKIRRNHIQRGSACIKGNWKLA